MDVLIGSLTAGVREGVFGTADETEDRDGNHYPNLRIAEPIDRVSETALIVREGMANMVMEERDRRASEQDLDPKPPTPGVIRENPTVIIPTPPAPPLPTRIAVRKTARGNIDMNAVSEMQSEIIRTLTEGGGEVTVSITITAARSVRENAGHLGLEIETDMDEGAS